MTSPIEKQEWTMAGHFSAELGIGEATRRLHSLLSAAGVAVEIRDFQHSVSQKQGTEIAPLDISRPLSHLISCVNADQLGDMISSIPGVSEIQAHVAFWSWELPDFPKAYRSASELVDHIWTVSDFAASAIRSTSSVPVSTVALPVPIAQYLPSKEILKKMLGLNPKEFLVVNSFDFLSDFNRKNPLDSVAAFRQAFHGSRDVRLIIKTINSEFDPANSQLLLESTASFENVTVLNLYMTRAQHSLLLAAADVFISLHRAEGYGINIVDAMARGTAAVATAYSGNLDFMNDVSSELVPYTLTPVSRYSGLRTKSLWAQPDVDTAGEKLRRFFNEPHHLLRISERGRKHIAKEHSLAHAVEAFRKGFTDGN